MVVVYKYTTKTDEKPVENEREKTEEDKMSKPTKEEKGYGYEEKDA